MTELDRLKNLGIELPSLVCLRCFLLAVEAGLLLTPGRDSSDNPITVTMCGKIGDHSTLRGCRITVNRDGGAFSHDYDLHQLYDFRPRHGDPTSIKCPVPPECPALPRGWIPLR